MGIRGKLTAARLLVALVPLAAVSTVVGPAGAGVATSVVVTTTADELVVDGDCSLREAMATVNSGVGFDACMAGSTTIQLPAGTIAFDGADLGELVAETSMVLVGVDAATSAIDELFLSTVLRAEAGVALTVQDLSISGGIAVRMDAGAGLLRFVDARASGEYAFLTEDSDVEVQGSTLGGGYFAVGQTTSGDVTVTGSTIQADDEGLGLRSTTGTITATDSTLDTQLVAPSIAIDRSFVGSCLECSPLPIGAGSLSLVNSTVAVPIYDPAISLSTGTATIVSSTIYAGADLPAISVTGTGTATVTGSIVTCASATGVSSGGGNVSDGSCGFAGPGDVVGDPKLLGAADNGGPTKTMSLAPGSAALDNAPTCPSIDQRGQPRPRDADGDGTPECDSGAIELAGPPSPPPPPPPPPITSKLVSGDWDGDGVDSVGYITFNTWNLRNSLTSGGIERQAVLGGTYLGTPIVGDWDGDGADGIGVAIQEATVVRWYLLDDLSSGPWPPEISFTYGRSGIPVVGDWDGNGTDDVGLVQGSTWFLRTSFGGGPADLIGRFGNAGDIPIAGDWDGDGVDTPGVVRGRTRFLKNDLSGGAADITHSYGVAGDPILVGDWNDDGIDTPGLVRSTNNGMAWHLRNSNTPGSADVVLRFGTS